MYAVDVLSSKGLNHEDISLAEISSLQPLLRRNENVIFGFLSICEMTPSEAKKQMNLEIIASATTATYDEDLSQLLKSVPLLL